jgi:hypothetical protein
MPTRWLFAACVCALARFAAAHPAPFSYLDLHLEPDATRGVLVVHDFDAAHELGIDEPQALLEPAVAREHAERLVAIIAGRLHLAIDARETALGWGDVAVLADRQSLRLSFEVATTGVGQLELEAVLFPYDPVHQTFINVYENRRLAHQAILDARNDRLTWYSAGVQGRWAVVKTFVRSGIEHILIGPDHILFLLGLLLLGGSLWRVAAIVTAFTLGHSVTLSLAVLGVVTVAPRLIEPAIALSIIVVGVDNLLVRGGWPATGTVEPRLRRDLRPWLAGAFGLIHGFGFAAVLVEIGLPREALAWSLAAFNVGVELGQLAVVTIMVALLAAVRYHDVLLARRCSWVGSLTVIAAGLFWFVQRVWFANA